MEPHIGQVIEKIAKEKYVKSAELARRINTTPQNLNAIFKRKSIDTHQLFVISKALGHDFFVLYTEEVKYSIGVNSMLYPTPADSLVECDKERTTLSEMLRLQTTISTTQAKYMASLEEKIAKLEGKERV